MSETIAIPHTGEIVDLDEPAQVARALADLRDLSDQLRDVRQVLYEALAEEGRRQGTRTLRLDEFEVNIGSDRKLVWDVPRLMDLRNAGLPQERLDALVQAVVEYKVDGTIIRQLAGSNPDYARIIEDARTYEPRSLWVGVKRASPKALTEGG